MCSSKIIPVSLIVVLCAFLFSCADGDRATQRVDVNQTLGGSFNGGSISPIVKVASQVESAADKLYSQSFAAFELSREAPELDTQSCHLDDTAIITIYSTNGMAQREIDVQLDGSSVGSLTTYFPDDEPGCKTPTDDGVITIMIPAGKHTLDAESANLSWPTHAFSVEKCECMSLPLS
jgi:hypothetical protein